MALNPALFPYAKDSLKATALDFFALLKPRVMTLVVYSGCIGGFLAPSALHPYRFFLSVLAIALGSGAAAALNMWYDRDIDMLMSRTRNRPVPAGRIAPHDALSFGIILSIVSIFLMALAANLLAALLLAGSILFYVFIYTIWLKRRTPQNIVIGGAAGAFPPLIGWAAVEGSLSLYPWILFLIIFLWTPYHFWALALFKCEDYKKANIPMLPVVSGLKNTQNQIFIYALLTVLVSLFPYVLAHAGLFYGIGSCVLGIPVLIQSYYLLKTYSEKAAIHLFQLSLFHLFGLFTCLAIDSML